MPNYEQFKKSQGDFYSKFKGILELIQKDPIKARKLAENDLKYQLLFQVIQNMSQQKPALPKDKPGLAAYIKEKGNKYYKARQYEYSIYCYNKALLLNPFEMIYYSNKAAA